MQLTTEQKLEIRELQIQLADNLLEQSSLVRRAETLALSEKALREKIQTTVEGVVPEGFTIDEKLELIPLLEDATLHEASNEAL